MKSCTRCLAEKQLTEFKADQRYAGGHTGWCKSCHAEYRKEYYAKNRQAQAEKGAAYYLANKAKVNERCRLNYEKNREAHINRARAAKDRRPDYYRALNAQRARERRATNPAARIRSRISAQLNYCLSTGKGGATSESLLGYTMAELRAHLERQFLKGMSWENMGQWHIDHIVPLASFNIRGSDDPELRRAWGLPNLRPLWAADNVAKRDLRVTLL